jgi:cystathionine beta-lyase/cystathionine gamma-synthase
MPKEYRTLATRLVHAGEPEPRIAGAVTMPIFQSATYEYGGEGSYHDVRYVRLNNTPNHVVLHAKLAAVEEAEAALVAASGMAAITATLLTVLSRGDHVLMLDSLYGGTHEFAHQDFPRFGIEFDVIDGDDPASWKTLLRPETRAIYVETITNPLILVPDHRAVVAFAREHGLVSMVDNTFASPVNFRPCPFGYDLSLHSGTKYLNGHSDISAGAVIGREDLVTRILHKLNLLGGDLDPHACFLLHRGLKTLALRVAQQNDSALAIARFLEEHPAVSRVAYPGLESHSAHARAKEWFAGNGGMLSFELKDGTEAAEGFCSRVQIPVVAPSLGGAETLVTLPATTSHAGLSPEERERIGIADGLVRVSVGIEDTDELIDDFRQALGP